MNCVTFLVSFGANLWALDNDFHTPLDVAALNEYNEIVRYLDSVVANQSALNHKVVKKLKEKASLEAQKRIKEYEKIQAKSQKRAEKDHKKLMKERLRLGYTDPIQVQDKDEKYQLKPRRNSKEPRKYSEHFTTTNGKKKLFGSGGVSKKIKQKRNSEMNGEFKVGEMEENGRRTVRSLGGLKRDSEVLFTTTERSRKALQPSLFEQDSRSDVSKSASEPDFHYNNGDSGVDSFDSNPQESASMFERPGFGSVSFLQRPVTSETMMSLPSNPTSEELDSSVDIDTTTTVNGRRGSGGSDSIGTLGSLAHRMKNIPWNDEDLGNIDDDNEEGSSLELFLAANHLTEFISLFSQEKIDLDALMLCSDADLKEIGVPLGPRRKILDAVCRRKETLDEPGTVYDSYL